VLGLPPPLLLLLLVLIVLTVVSAEVPSELVVAEKVKNLLNKFEFDLRLLFFVVVVEAEGDEDI
jgi:Ni2+-binding GTPase involved in maturation of urease and hydrogenase